MQRSKKIKVVSTIYVPTGTNTRDVVRKLKKEFGGYIYMPGQIPQSSYDSPLILVTNTTLLKSK